jgi:hypothetical protein
VSGCTSNTRSQPVRHLFEVLKFHRYVKPIKNRRFQDARAGENTPKSGTTIGEGRQHGVPVSANCMGIMFAHWTDQTATCQQQ